VHPGPNSVVSKSRGEILELQSLNPRTLAFGKDAAPEIQIQEQDKIKAAPPAIMSSVEIFGSKHSRCSCMTSGSMRSNPTIC